MLSTRQIAQISSDVKQAATMHLHAKDADAALKNFADDALAVSNTKVFSSRESLAADIREYYRMLKTVRYASFEDVHIHVISDGAATFTARFRYGFISTDGSITELRGVWTALYVLDEETWKIRLRHESFEQI